MTWWLVDHVDIIYFLLGFAALWAAVVFWQTRRGRELVAIVVIFGLAVLVWFLCGFVMTDRKQIENNMRELADGALEHKPEKILPLLAKDFEFKQPNLPPIKREVIAHAIARTAEAHGVSNHKISSFTIEKVTRTPGGGEAAASFLLRVDHSHGIFQGLCRVTFVLEGEQWRLKTISLHNPAVDNDTPLQIPLPH